MEYVETSCKKRGNQITTQLAKKLLCKMVETWMILLQFVEIVWHFKNVENAPFEISWLNILRHFYAATFSTFALIVTSVAHFRFIIVFDRNSFPFCSWVWEPSLFPQKILVIQVLNVYDKKPFLYSYIWITHFVKCDFEWKGCAFAACLFQ